MDASAVAAEVRWLQVVLFIVTLWLWVWAVWARVYDLPWQVVFKQRIGLHAPLANWLARWYWRVMAGALVAGGAAFLVPGGTWFGAAVLVAAPAGLLMAVYVPAGLPRVVVDALTAGDRPPGDAEAGAVR